MKKIIVVFLFLPFYVSAQQYNIDSIKNELRTNQSDSLRYETLYLLNWLYLEINPDSALHYAHEAVKFIAIKKSKLPFWTEWNGSQMLGLALLNQGNYPDAKDAFFKQAKQSEAVKDSLGMLKAYSNLGILNRDEGNYNSATIYFKKSLSFYHDQPESWWQWVAMTTLEEFAKTYEQTNILDSALYYAQQSLQLSLKTYDKEYKYNVGNILGVIYSKMKQPALAIDYFRLYLRDFANINPQIKYKALCYYEMAKHFERNNQLDSAIFYATKAFQINQRQGFKTNILNTSILLNRLYKSEKSIDSAYKYQSIMIDTKEYLFGREKLSRLQTIEFNEQIRQKDLESRKLKAEEEWKQNIQYAFITIGLVCLILMFLLLSRSFITNTRFIQFFGIIALLLIFEFLNLLLHPFLERITHHSPIFMLLGMVCIAALIVPLHHRLEKWATIKVVEKNKQIRLAAAKKTIEKLEGKLNK